MFKTTGAEFIEDTFSSMTKGGVSKVMSQSYCLYKILIETEGSGNCSCNLGYFQGMGKSCTVVISNWVK